MIVAWAKKKISSLIAKHKSVKQKGATWIPTGWCCAHMAPTPPEGPGECEWQSRWKLLCASKQWSGEKWQWLFKQARPIKERTGGDTGAAAKTTSDYFCHNYWDRMWCVSPPDWLIGHGCKAGLAPQCPHSIPQPLLSMAEWVICHFCKSDDHLPPRRSASPLADDRRNVFACSCLAKQRTASNFLFKSQTLNAILIFSAGTWDKSTD